MGPIAAVLDVVQGKETAYLDVLLPTIVSLLNAFAAKTDADLECCFPLLENNVQGLKDRWVITTFVYV